MPLAGGTGEVCWPDGYVNSWGRHPVERLDRSEVADNQSANAGHGESSWVNDDQSPTRSGNSPSNVTSSLCVATDRSDRKLPYGIFRSDALLNNHLVGGMEAYPMSVDFNLRALKTTDAELTLIASAAIKGDRRCPVSGYSSPAASGIPIAL